MELVKTAGVEVGRELFYYRDQNGVEIDFVLERGRTITLIEAKAAQRPDPRKLGFDKVEPLLAGRYDTECLVACNLDDDSMLKKNRYSSFNPLRRSLADD